MGKEPSICERVRQFASANSMVRKKQIAEALELTVNQVRTAVESLIAQGYLKQVSHGVYEFTDRKVSAREAPVDDRIWHAMRINPSWSASDIAMQAGSTTSYIYKQLRYYRAEGFVRQAGQRAVPGGREKLWRLTLKGCNHLIKPQVDPFEPDSLVVMAVKLNKLVCTGAAMRFVDEREEAKRLCSDIGYALSDRSNADGSKDATKSNCMENEK